MANWYVATTGSDLGGDGSSGNPYRTINKAISVLAELDTIYCANGTYATEVGIATTKSFTLESSSGDYTKVIVKPLTLIDGHADGFNTWLYTTTANLLIRLKNLTFIFDKNVITNVDTDNALITLKGASSRIVSTNCFFLSQNWTGRSFGILTILTTNIINNLKCTFRGFSSNNSVAVQQAGNSYIYNSIFEGNYYGIYIASGTCNENYNDFYNNISNKLGGGALGANDITSNPDFISTTSAQIDTDSPCKDVGVVTSAFSLDLTGQKTATGSSQVNTSNAVTKINDDNFTNSGWLAIDNANEWAYINFVFYALITQITILASYNDPGNQYCWIAGSNDATNWTKVSAVGWSGSASVYNTDEVYLTNSGTGTVTLGGTTYYRYWRIFFYSSSATYIGSTEIQMMENSIVSSYIGTYPDIGCHELVNTVIPTVETDATTSITTIGATLHGEITATGEEDNDERGFDWGVETGVYTGSWTEVGTFGTGTFSHAISGLDLNTTYFFRAKAHNLAGWGYSAEDTFLTLDSSVIQDSFDFYWSTFKTINSSLGFYWLTTFIHKFGHLVNYPIQFTSPSIGDFSYPLTVTGCLHSLSIHIGNTGDTGQLIFNIYVNSTLKQTVTIDANNDEYSDTIYLDNSIIKTGDIIKINITSTPTNISDLNINVFQATLDNKLNSVGLYNRLDTDNCEYRNTYLFTLSDYWTIYLNQPISSISLCYLRDNSLGSTQIVTSVLTNGFFLNNKINVTIPTTFNPVNYNELVLECLDLNGSLQTIVIPVKIRETYTKLPKFIKEETVFITYLNSIKYQYSWNNSNWSEATDTSNNTITIDPEETTAGGSSTEGLRTLYMRYLIQDTYGNIVSTITENTSIYYYTSNIDVTVNLKNIVWNDLVPPSKVEIYQDSELADTISFTSVIQGFIDLNWVNSTLSATVTGTILEGDNVFSFVDEVVELTIDDPEVPFLNCILYYSSVDNELHIRILDNIELSLRNYLDNLGGHSKEFPIWYFTLDRNRTPSVDGVYTDTYSIISFELIIDNYINKLDLSEYTSDIEVIFYDILDRTKTIDIPYFKGGNNYSFKLRVYTDVTMVTEVLQGEIHSDTELYYNVEET